MKTSRSLAALAVAGLLASGLRAAPALAEETKTAAQASPVDEAVKLFEAGQFDEAIAAAEAVPADDPLRARALYLVGEFSLALGDATKAEASLREASEKKPGSAAILGALGHALLVAERPGDAVEPLRKAVAADAKTARYRAWLGLALARDEKADEGRKETAAAEKADPADAEVVRAAVEERLLAKDVDGAAKFAAAYVKARKDSALGPFLQGLVLDRAKKVDEAIAAYEKAIALDATFLDAHKNLAILCIAQNPVYTNAKRTAIALDHFEKYRQLGGRDPKVLEVYAQLEGFLKAPANAPGK